MKIDFTGRGFDITPKIRTHTQSKLERLQKHLEDIHDVTVIFSVEKYRQKCEINFLSSKHSFHGQEETDDMFSSIDGVIEKLEKQARKMKTKRIAGKRKGSESLRLNGALTEEEQAELKIIRTPISELETMTLEEAVDVFQDSKRDHLIFQNLDNNSLSVVFRRRDGHVGFVLGDA